MKYLSYSDARSRMNIGDVIAFGGDSHFSEIIKMAIRAEVPHIGIVRETRQTERGVTQTFLMDATSRRNVCITDLAARVQEYAGHMWWLPLHETLRRKIFDEEACSRFLQQQNGKKYDRWQAAGSAIDALDELPFNLGGLSYNREDLSQLFCSELVAAALKVGGIIPQHLNASEITPIDICRWKIYAPEYYLLKGEFKEISGYNSIDLNRGVPTGMLCCEHR